MIEVRQAELEEVEVGAVLRPVSCDFAPVTPAMRRFDQAAGPAVAEQCGRMGELPLGSAVITAGGGTAADFIVHVAVRSVDEAATPAVVQRGLVNGLRRLEEWGIRSVAFAPLGAGAGNLDAEESASAMLPVLADHIRSTGQPERAVLVAEDAYQESAFRAAVAQFAGELAGTGS